MPTSAQFLNGQSKLHKVIVSIWKRFNFIVNGFKHYPVYLISVTCFKRSKWNKNLKVENVYLPPFHDFENHPVFPASYSQLLCNHTNVHLQFHLKSDYYDCSNVLAAQTKGWYHTVY